MRKFIGLAILTAMAWTACDPARADDGQSTKAILDKAMKALGGEESLSAG
jgi:hypothetical protein